MITIIVEKKFYIFCVPRPGMQMHQANSIASTKPEKLACGPFVSGCMGLWVCVMDATVMHCTHNVRLHVRVCCFLAHTRVYTIIYITHKQTCLSPPPPPTHTIHTHTHTTAPHACTRSGKTSMSTSPRAQRREEV